MTETSSPHGLPGDQGEHGPVTRIKDIVTPFAGEAGAGTALIGFASDAGVKRNFGRTGAAAGPKDIREFLWRLPVHGPLPLWDAGDVACRDDKLEDAQAALADKVCTVLRASLRPVVLGGGHEVAFGSFSGLSRFLGPDIAGRRIGIVNLDAHFDLRQAERPNSGTPFRQIAELCAEKGTSFNYLCYGISALGNTTALFDRARELGVHFRFDEDLREPYLPEILDDLTQRLAAFDDIYLSVDLDVLPAGTAPGVSAPAARGVALPIIEDLIDIVLRSGKLRLADIAELNPTHDIDHQTARIAARIAYRLTGAAMRA